MQTEQVDDLHLVPLPSALGCAETFVRFSLTEWSLRPMADHATALVRALVAAEIRRANPAAPAVIKVRLRLAGAQLLVEVESQVPGRPPAHMDDRIKVAALPGGGHLCWGSLPLPTGMTAAAVPLPTRTRRPSPASEALGDQDIGAPPDTLLRILDGLNRGRHSP